MSSFEFRKSFRKHFRLPSDAGICPERWLPWRNSSSKLNNCPRESGIAPGNRAREDKRKRGKEDESKRTISRGQERTRGKE